MDKPQTFGRPQRKSLPHAVPSWIDPSKEVYFITINALPRGENHLCYDAVFREIKTSLDFQQTRRDWHCHLCVVMPDHLHLLVTFSSPCKGISGKVADWKRWLSCQCGLRWQSNHFEHRIRSDDEEAAKSSYMLKNPVRAGLASRWEDWPYVWRPGSISESDE